MTPIVVHNGVALPASPPGNVRSEFRALVEECGVYSLSARAKISLTGSDRTRWLNGMVTNNIRDLAPGRGVYAFLLNPQGHILGDLYAYNCGESLILDTDQSQSAKLLPIFDHYIIMDDVEITDLSEKLTAVGIAGPKSHEVLRAAGIEFPALEQLQFLDIQWRGTTVTAVRAANPAIDSYELWFDPAQISLAQEALAAAGASPVGAAALDLLRIAAGIPRYGQDIRERDLPQETDQHRALHFSKGCYIGQEIVERIRSRGAVHRKFTGFHVQGKLPVPGTNIQSDGKDAGEVTSSASLSMSAGELAVALGCLRREAAVPGKQLLAESSQLTIAALPFTEVFSRPNQ